MHGPGAAKNEIATSKCFCTRITLSHSLTMSVSETKCG